MGQRLRVHFDNAEGWRRPRLWWRVEDGRPHQVEPCGEDEFGPLFEFEVEQATCTLTLVDGAGPDDGPERPLEPNLLFGDLHCPDLWARARNAWLYNTRPRDTEPESAEELLSGLPFKDGDLYVPDTGGLTAQGAHVLADGRVVFCFFHPCAARVYLAGDFNHWEAPNGSPPEVPGEDHPDGNPIELRLYRGWHHEPNLWIVVTDQAKPGDGYNFVVYGGVSEGDGYFRKRVADPYARSLTPDPARNLCQLVDPTVYEWRDRGWKTPEIRDVILYEFNCHGLTTGHPDIAPERQGTFRGLLDLIERGYFEELGVNTLNLLPVHEVPVPQGPETMGYDPVLLFAIERDYGTPDELRAVVDAAHRHGLAVVLDVILNHMYVQNQMWQSVLLDPADMDEQFGGGGHYFSGMGQWGPVLKTEDPLVQHFLIDCCKYFLTEYHVDGFRFDGLHTRFTSRDLTLRLWRELREFKPDGLYIAEDLPNEPDLKQVEPCGFPQWDGEFHAKLSALLREGPLKDTSFDDRSDLVRNFYFNRCKVARHTSNVIHYIQTHDEHSVPHFVASNTRLQAPEVLDRKGRLSLFAVVVTLGQPMLSMGQEYNLDRPRHVLVMEWPDRATHPFYQWTRRLLHLRRLPGLKVQGFDPVHEGTFEWLVEPSRPGPAHQRNLLAWRTMPGPPDQELVVLLNFEPTGYALDLPLGRGHWAKLADLEQIPDDPEVFAADADGRYRVEVPPYAGLLYQRRTR